MLNIKKKLSTALIALTLTAGAVATPVRDANAGILVAVAGTAVVNPALGVTMIVGGFGTYVASIYYGIANMKNPRKAWLAYGMFCLDEDLQSGKLAATISAKFPGVDSFVADEIAALVSRKLESTSLNAQGLKDVTLTEEELASVFELVEATTPEQLEGLKASLTQSVTVLN